MIPTRCNGFEDARVGGGAPCVKTDVGWLQIYHGASHEHRYCLFGALFDLEQPWKLIARSEQPIFEPTADYEEKGFFGGVVFTSGLLVHLYYGAADTSVCLVQADLNDVLAVMRGPA